MSCLKKRAAQALFCALSYNAYKGRVSGDFLPYGCVRIAKR